MTQTQQRTGSSPSYSSVETRLIDAEHLTLWAEYHIREQLEPACESSDGEITPDNAVEMLKGGNGQIWAVLQGGEWIATLLTELSEYVSGKRICRILLAGADSVRPIASSVIPHIPEVLQTIEAFALENDCTSVRMEGQARLGRWCPGYNEIYRTYSRDLRN